MKYLVTDLYADFSCIGGKCSNTCCQGWSIYVDERAMHMYQQLEEPHRSWILDKIVKGENGYEMLRDQQGRCPFLRDDNLCDMYRKISPDSLCQTCQQFPRKINGYGDTIIGTVSLACPEVVRMLLQHLEPIQFIYAENGGEELGTNVAIEQQDGLMQGLVATCGVLQKKCFHLKERLQLVIELNMEIQNCLEKQELYKIASICEQYKVDALEKKSVEDMDIHVCLPKGAWDFIFSMFETLESYHISEGNYQQLIGKIHKLKRQDEDIYRKWYEELCAIEFAEEQEHLAIQLIFEYYMDALNGKSLVVNITKMLLFLIVVKTLEVIEYHETENMSEEQKIRIISSLSRVVEHSPILEKMAEQLVMTNGKEQIYQLLYCL